MTQGSAARHSPGKKADGDSRAGEQMEMPFLSSVKEMGS